jgi:transcriptional regulator with XRE-family HTH domain
LSSQYGGNMATEGFPSARDRALMLALKGALTESGYVVETMAAEVGISKESLGRYLRFEREMGTATFARICAALAITPAEMFDRAAALHARTLEVTAPHVTASVPESALTEGTKRSTRDPRGSAQL